MTVLVKKLAIRYLLIAALLLMVPVAQFAIEVFNHGFALALSGETRARLVYLLVNRLILAFPIAAVLLVREAVRTWRWPSPR